MPEIIRTKYERPQEEEGLVELSIITGARDEPDPENLGSTIRVPIVSKAMVPKQRTSLRPVTMTISTGKEVSRNGRTGNE